MNSRSEWQTDSSHPAHGFQQRLTVYSKELPTHVDSRCSTNRSNLLPGEGEDAPRDSNEDEPDIIRRKNAASAIPVPVAKHNLLDPVYLPQNCILNLLCHLKSMTIEILIVDTAKSAAISAAGPVGSALDFIYNALIRINQREQEHRELMKRVRPQLGGGWKLCKQLKHYKQPNPRQRGMGVLSEPQILRFAERQFNVSHLPDGIPADISDMKQEANRLKSFGLEGWPAFSKLCSTGQKPEDLAASGFFYMLEKDKVKCAFCLGVLYDWDLGESVDEAHRTRYSTCPLLLGLDVGNVPIDKEPAPLEPAPSQQCSEDSGSSEATRDTLPAAPVVGESWQLPVLTAFAELPQRPSLPVSRAAAVAACRPNAADNLDMLARSLHSRDAAARYHPMQHPNRQDFAARLHSLASSSSSSSVQALPADLLASAGFFLDAELRATCYWCGLQLLQLLHTDDAWLEHARWSPRCCHLLLERGHEFVALVRARHPPYLPPAAAASDRGAAAASGSADDEDATSGGVGFVSSGAGAGPLIDYRVEPRHFKAREDFPTSLGVLALGCDPDDARTAQFLQLKGTGEDFRTGEQFLASALAQFSRRSQMALGGREFYEHTQQEQELLRSRQPKPFEDEELDWRACKVCMDKVINVTLLDCKHLCCCSECARHLDTCPLCRAPIRATMLVNVD